MGKAACSAAAEREPDGRPRSYGSRMFGSGFGGTVAAPIAKTVVQTLLAEGK